MMAVSNARQGIAVATLLQVDASDNAEVGQDLQRAVDCSQTDAGAGRLGFGVQFGWIQILARRDHDTQHSPPLLGVLEAMRVQFPHKAAFAVP